MGFFSDLKEDLSQAVNELMPEDEQTQEEGFGDINEMLDRVDSIVVPEVNQEEPEALEPQPVEEPEVLEELPVEEPGTTEEPGESTGRIPEEYQAGIAEETL